MKTSGCTLVLLRMRNNHRGKETSVIAREFHIQEGMEAYNAAAKVKSHDEIAAMEMGYDFHPVFHADIVFLFAGKVPLVPQSNAYGYSQFVHYHDVGNAWKTNDLKNENIEVGYYPNPKAITPPGYSKLLNTVNQVEKQVLYYGDTFYHGQIHGLPLSKLMVFLSDSTTEGGYLPSYPSSRVIVDYNTGGNTFSEWGGRVCIHLEGQELVLKVVANQGVC